MRYKFNQVRKSLRVFNNNHPRLILGLKIAIVYGLFFAYAWRSLDPDFGWHLSSGNYIRQHWIPAHDIYTYTARSFPWINHEWGNDVIASLLYSAGGYFTLSVVYSAIWTSAVMIGAGLKTRLPFLLLATGAILQYSGIRTVAWTALLLVVLLRMTASKSRSVLYSIPLLFLVWANLHAGFIAGFGILAFLAVKQRRKIWIYILAASILASFVNPYGPRLYVEIFRTLADRELHGQINEWFPVHMPTLSWIFAIFWASGFVLFTRRKLANLLNLSLILLLSALTANRNVPLFVVASVKDLNGYFSRALKVLPKNLDIPRKLIICFTAGMVLSVTLLGAYDVYATVSDGNREADYPVQAVAYLTSHPCQGNLFNDYNYGGFLIWKLPSEPVFIDGRMPSWRDPSGHKYLDTYFAILKTPSVQKSQFKKYNIQCVLLGSKASNYKIVKRLQAAGWKTAVAANHSFLLISPETKAASLKASHTLGS